MYGMIGQGNVYGVQGYSNGTWGAAVAGNALEKTGRAIGVYGTSDSPDGYGGYFNGRLYVTGNVGIGTGNPTYPLDVAGTANLNNGYTEGIALAVNGAEALWANDTYYSWGYGKNYNFFATPVTIGTIEVPGYSLVVNGDAAKIGGGSWSESSDERLKNLKGNYTKGLKDIMELQPVKFTYKEGNPRKLDSDKEQIGFVAQDVQKVFPEAVKLCKDGYLDFNIHSINVALVNAVKELKTENDQLKAEIEQINSRLEALEKLIKK